jgi:hypothetical protein
MGARNRVGIWLSYSYQPARLYVGWQTFAITVSDIACNPSDSAGNIRNPPSSALLLFLRFRVKVKFYAFSIVYRPEESAKFNSVYSTIIKKLHCTNLNFENLQGNE